MVVLLWCNQSIFETLLEVFLSGCKSDLVVVGVIFLENDPNCLNNLQIIFGNFHKSVVNGKRLISFQVFEGSSSDINLLLEREKNYKQAIENANKAGEGSKARRYGRGLKV